MANGHVERRFVRRTLRAVAQWIVDNEAEHQATLEGAAGLVLEAGRRMRAAESKTEP